MEALKSEPQHFNLVIKTSKIAAFLKLIASGFKLRIKAGLSIRELFCDQLGISDDYFANRIQTIFLDGKPVDNEDTTRVYNGARIAFSTAMPGLVGATLRKGGQYASFRGTITHSEAANSDDKGEGEIILKFFNMIARELGPIFLQKGIIIESRRFHDFVWRNLDGLKAGCKSIYLNDEKMDVAGLLEMNWENMDILLKVAPEQKL